jgi:hypothetical protein
LAVHSEGETKEYAISMIATLEFMRGNYGKAIKELRSLPENPTD